MYVFILYNFLELSEGLAVKHMALSLSHSLARAHFSLGFCGFVVGLLFTAGKTVLPDPCTACTSVTLWSTCGQGWQRTRLTPFKWHFPGMLCSQRSHWGGICALVLVDFHFYGLLYDLVIGKRFPCCPFIYAALRTVRWQTTSFILSL